MERKSSSEQPIPKVKDSDCPEEEARASNILPDDLKTRHGAAEGHGSQGSHGSVSGVPASPPNFVSMDEIVKAAKGVNQMHIAHEIALDPDFHLKPFEVPQNSLAGVVKDMLHSAFWNILAEELNETPPKYEQALRLLEEIKENLLGLIVSSNGKLRQQINEVLDINLIKQQAEQGTIDFHKYVQYVLDFMSKMCAPVRDEQIQELKTRTEIVPIFLGILETLSLMKMDFANFHIQMLKPVLRAHNVTFEKTKFAEFLEKVGGVEFLTDTKKWLRRHIDQLEEADRNVPADDVLAVRRVCAKVLGAAYIDLLEWNPAEKYPETILMDEARYQDFQRQFKRLVISGSVLLLTLSRLQIPTLYSMQSFKDKLRQDVSLLLNDDTLSDEDLAKMLPNVAVQVAEESRKCLAEHGPAGSADLLNAQVEHDLAEILQGLSRPDQPIRQLVWLRIKEFLQKALVIATDVSQQIPQGLSALRSDLLPLTGYFVRLVNYNRSVFGEYYLEIISNELKQSPS